MPSYGTTRHRCPLVSPIVPLVESTSVALIRLELWPTGDVEEGGERALEWGRDGGGRRKRDGVGEGKTRTEMEKGRRRMRRGGMKG